jgi:hypothetical protein
MHVDMPKNALKSPDVEYLSRHDDQIIFVGADWQRETIS